MQVQPNTTRAIGKASVGQATLAHSCNCAGFSRKVHIMYKLVYNSDKRIIVFKNALQLARYLKPVDVKRRNFRLYKKGN